MEISKGLQLEIRSVQSKLKNAIRDHQIYVGKLKDDPNNADILDRIQEIQVHIVSLGRCQKLVVQRLRKEVEDYKAANANEVKVSVATLLGINNNNHITANNESTNDDISDVKVLTNGHDSGRIANAKEDYEDSVRNGEVVTSHRQNLHKKERSISVETVSADDEEVIEVDNDTREMKREMSEEPLDERKIKCTEQLTFLEVLGLITTLKSSELQNRRAERKRRSTANPQFVYSNWEMPTKRKRHSYLQSAGNVPQTRQTTARLNGPSPPPICNKTANSIVPPKSTSPPTRTSSKSLIPVQKATTRPNILRNMSESRVFPNKNNKLENGNGQLQLSSLTTKTENCSTTNSKAIHIPGLPSGLTIERIENDSAVCINCRNPGTLTNCENCEANYHISCHSISPPPPSLCPKCAIKMKYATGAIKKNDELAAASYAPGVAGKAGEDPEINKASGGFYKIGSNAKQQFQQRKIFARDGGIDELSRSSIVEPIGTKSVTVGSSKSDYVIATFGGSELYLVGSKGVIAEAGSQSAGPSSTIVTKVSRPRVTASSLADSGVGYVRNVTFGGDARGKKIVEESRVERVSGDRERIGESGSIVSRIECNDKSGKDIDGSRVERGKVDSKVADVNGIQLAGSVAQPIARGAKKSTIRAIPGLTRIVPCNNNDKSQSTVTPEHSNHDHVDKLQSLGDKHGCAEKLADNKRKFVDRERNDNGVYERFGKFGESKNTGGESSRNDRDIETTESLFTRERPKFGSILHSLFTGYNKPDNVSLRRDERNTASSSRDGEIFGEPVERFDQCANDDISGRREIFGSREHVKLEEAHLSAPPRAMLMRDIDEHIEITRSDDRRRRMYTGGAMFAARRRTTDDETTIFPHREVYDCGKYERRQLPRILMRSERKSLESRDATGNDTSNQLSIFESGKFGESSSIMAEKETPEFRDNDCNSGGDTSATEDANSPIMFHDEESAKIEDGKDERGRIDENGDDDDNSRGKLEIDEDAISSKTAEGTSETFAARSNILVTEIPSAVLSTSVKEESPRRVDSVSLPDSVDAGLKIGVDEIEESKVEGERNVALSTSRNECNDGNIITASGVEPPNSKTMCDNDDFNTKNAIERANDCVENVNDDNDEDNNTRGKLEIDEETEDNEEDVDDVEHQDCPIVDDDIRQGANLGVRIGTISPESMKVLELFENAMMQVENGDKTANP